jgi:prepilin-type N-terminal cleavage/methylation domain-containing protein
VVILFFGVSISGTIAVMKRGHIQKGFTIVELLIVVVVIAILAAISIVAYNGITNRAKVSAASSALNQAVKKIALYKTTNADQLPVGATEAGLGANFEYRRFDNNTNYCVSVVSGGVSYYVRSSSENTYVQGSCSGVESIAGASAPLGQVVTSSSLSTSFADTSGSPDIILYTVFDSFNTDGNYNTIAAFTPITSTQRMMMDTGPAGDIKARYRIDTSVLLNQSDLQASVRTSGRHIGWLQVRNGMTIREFAYDKAVAASSIAMTPGTPWSFTGLTLGSATSSTAPIAAMAFNAAHDQGTRARVMQWLADSYNVPATY